MKFAKDMTYREFVIALYATQYILSKANKGMLGDDDYKNSILVANKLADEIEKVNPNEQ